MAQKEIFKDKWVLTDMLIIKKQEDLIYKNKEKYKKILKDIHTKQQLIIFVKELKIIQIYKVKMQKTRIKKNRTLI